MNKYILFLIVTAVVISGCTASMRFSSKARFAAGKSISTSHIQAPTLKQSRNIRFTDDTEKSNVVFSDSDTSNSILLRGNASYYGDEFQGRMTTNGEIYLHENFTAAHRTLPFGTFLLVTNLKNNQSVVVRVNDRGPFKPGRILDLSFAAAEELDMIRDGVIEVKIAIIE